MFVPRGVDVPPLDKNKTWLFKRKPNMKVGTIVTGGDIIGTVFENNLFDEHRILIPPKAKGRISYIAEDDNYTITDKILELEHDGKTVSFSMSHYWPVR